MSQSLISWKIANKYGWCGCNCAHNTVSETENHKVAAAITIAECDLKPCLIVISAYSTING